MKKNQLKIILMLIAFVTEDLLAQKADTKKPSKTLQEITVEGTIEQNEYHEGVNSVATKSSLPLLNTPQNVAVLNRKLLEDTGVQRIDELLHYTSGVQPSSRGYRHGIDFYGIRGFWASYNSYKDGLSIDHRASYQELYGLEKIELLKGPAAALYGYAPVGGMLHFTSKKPIPKNFLQVRLGGGSYKLFEQGADIGIVNKNKSLYFRLVVLNRKQNSFIDIAKSSRQYFAPSITWDITKSTKLTLLARYQTDQSVRASSLPAIGTVKKNPDGPPIPITTYFGNKSLNQYISSIGQIGYEFGHTFSNFIFFRHNFRYSKTFNEGNNAFFPIFFMDNHLTMISLDHQKFKNLFHTDTAVEFKFSTFRVDHNLMIGFDAKYLDVKKSSKENVFTRINIYKPRDWLFPKTEKNWPKPKPNISQGAGLYIQENLIFYGLTFNLGGRYDIFAGEVDRDTDRRGPKTIKTKPSEDYAMAFSPKIGANYEFIKGFAIYSNYSESYETQRTKTDKNGKSFSPLKGINIEAGVKVNTLHGKLISSLTFYQLTKKDIALEHPTEKYYVSIGRQRSRGVEFDASFNPIAGLSFIMAYTFTNAKLVNEFPNYKGKTMSGVPKHSMSTWIKYTFQSTLLKDLGFGLGGRYFTDQYGDLGNSFILPAYGVLDASIFYILKNTKAQINFYNILNKDYFRGSLADVYILPGQPFNFRASVTSTF